MSPAPKKLLTLSEVSKRTGISMPTLQKYKKQHADVIPSEGEGRRQRYPLAALKVFQQLKEEGLARRGRRPADAAKGSDSDLLSLQEIKRRTGISYPTLLRYVRLHLDQLPHEGTGRKRRFRPEAVEVFQELRRTTKRGRKPKSESAATKPAAARSAAADTKVLQRLAALERSQLALQKQLAEVTKLLRKPIQISVKR